jgi:hypothetical protein
MLLLDNSFSIHKESKPQLHEYVPYTTTSMIDTTSSKFYENFWNSVIKEDTNNQSEKENNERNNNR